MRLVLYYGRRISHGLFASPKPRLFPRFIRRGLATLGGAQCTQHYVDGGLDSLLHLPPAGALQDQDGSPSSEVHRHSQRPHGEVLSTFVLLSRSPGGEVVCSTGAVCVVGKLHHVQHGTTHAFK